MLHVGSQNRRPDGSSLPTEHACREHQLNYPNWNQIKYIIPTLFHTQNNMSMDFGVTVCWESVGNTIQYFDSVSKLIFTTVIILIVEVTPKCPLSNGDWALGGLSCSSRMSWCHVDKSSVPMSIRCSWWSYGGLWRYTAAQCTCRHIVHGAGEFCYAYMYEHM